MIRVNVEKAKAIAHELRRAARAADFEPHDRIVALQIPGASADAAEAARAVIRAKYGEMQRQIDAAQDLEAIKAALFRA